MLRAIATAGAIAAIAGLSGCGHQPTAGASPDSATLAGYVVDSSATPVPQGHRPDSVCSTGQDAYRVLVFLVSSETGLSVPRIAADLHAGRSLDDIAGARSPAVRARALGLVQDWVRFARANGRLTADEAQRYMGAAAVIVAGLMAANVTSCVPATS